MAAVWPCRVELTYALGLDSRQQHRQWGARQTALHLSPQAHAIKCSHCCCMPGMHCAARWRCAQVALSSMGTCSTPQQALARWICLQRRTRPGSDSRKPCPLPAASCRARCHRLPQCIKLLPCPALPCPALVCPDQPWPAPPPLQAWREDALHQGAHPPGGAAPGRHRGPHLWHHRH
jgi:hypothetical protein